MRKVIKKVKKISLKFPKLYSFFKKEPQKLIPQIYALGLLLAFILTLLYSTFPSLYTCSNLFGQEFCTPTGIFLGMTLSLPGYVIAGNLLVNYFDKIPTLLGFLIVFLTSLLFYFLIGLFIDKYKKEDFNGRIKLLVLSLFVLLSFFLLVFI